MRIEKQIYTHDTAITNGQIHWSLKLKIYMIYS